MSPRYAVLSDAPWTQIAPLMPESAGKLGRPFKDHRLMTERSSTGIGPASRGGTCRRSSGRGRRSGNATAATVPTGPGTRLLLRC